MRDNSVMRPLVWSSHIHKTPLQILASSLCYLVHFLYHYHQCVLDHIQKYACLLA